MAELLTVPEVANYLRVTEKTVYRLLEKKSIPASRVGRQWRFEKWEIDLWLRQTSKEVRARIDILNQATTHLAELVMNGALQTALQGKRLEEV